MSDDEIRAIDGDGFDDADIDGEPFGSEAFDDEVVADAEPADVLDDAERPDHDVDAGVDDVQEVDEPESGAGGASGWQVPEPTGVQAVDEAVEPLLELDHLPTSEHVASYEVAHRRLQDALADLDGS